MIIAPNNHGCEQHEFQDREYGRKRCYNETATTGKIRCTVCGKEQSQR